MGGYETAFPPFPCPRAPEVDVEATPAPPEEHPVRCVDELYVRTVLGIENTEEGVGKV